jgi:lipid kinase, YegS/Rv2252/BmrU family
MSLAGKKFLLIINPASGTVSKHRIVPRLYRKMLRMAVDFDIAFSRGPGHVHELAAEAAEKSYYGVIACGGDGTVNEAATGLIGTATALGIVPTGSGNGLARHIGIPIDIDLSLKIIAENNIINADYGTANGVPFFCTFGVGFDAAVSERCARENRRGALMYLKNSFTEYIKFHPEEYQIRVGNQILTERAFLVVCCNASQYGNNAFIAPQASITDGALDFVIVHAGNIFTQAAMGFDMLTGLIKKNSYIDVIRASEAVITRKTDGAAHADGDSVRMPATIEVKCHPGKLRLFAPTEGTRFKPVVTPARLFLHDIGLSIRHILPPWP